MTTVLHESDVEFRFDETWIAVKWDDCEFRSRREQYGRAADVVASRQIDASTSLYVMEAKDYPDHPLAVVPPPAELAIVCAEKARDTIAQMLHSPPLVGRPTEEDVEVLCRRFGATEYPLHFILFVQDANIPPLDFIELQAELDRALRWLPTESIAMLLLDSPPWPDGLRVRRIAA